MYKVQREGRLLKREEGQGTLFINRIGGEKGSVSQLWLKMHCYEGGDGRAKGLFTSFFHLLDLEGERKGMEQACTRGRAASLLVPCASPSHSPGGPAAPFPTHLCVPDPSPPPATTAPAAETASATQRSPADWKARMQPHSCQCPQEGHGPLVEAGSGNSSSGSRESCERK